MQPRHHSFYEALLNTASGFVVSLLTTAIVFPWFGYQMDWSKNIRITLIFTVVSVVRSYIWRRIFNARLHRAH